jgi:hypothetical protein
MDEMIIKNEAYETMRKALEEKFTEAFTSAWSKILMNNVDEVVDKLKEKNYECEKV